MKVMKYRFTGIVGCFLLLTGCTYFAISSDEISASSNYGNELASVPNLNNFQSFNGDGITGAQIDESQIKQTIHVDINYPSASDSNSGLQENPFKSLSAALEKAKEYLRQGEDAKIVIHPGVYREGEIVIDGNNLGSEAKDALLVIEGTEKGRVIISGSEEWQPDTWKRVGSYYQHDWPYDFGNDGAPWGEHGPKKVIAHRSEMVFINGKPLKQVLLEKYNYTWPDSWGGRGNHEYSGFDAPQNVLESGTFGVAELDENGNKIYIQPADGVDFANAKIEVATKRFLLDFSDMENLVLRNLNFQHSANELTSGAAVRVGSAWDRDEFENNNILIEDCDFRWNNARGLVLAYNKNVTLRRNTFNYNGLAGITVAALMNTVWEDNETSFNNWRGYRSSFTAWAHGGAKLGWVRDGVFRRHQSIGNMTPGLWFDVGNSNILIEDLTAVKNVDYGLWLEISPGPFLVRQALLADNGWANLLIAETNNTTIENSIVYGVDGINGVDGIGAIHFWANDRTYWDKIGQIFGENNGEELPITLGKVGFRNNVMIVDEINQAVILQASGKPENYRDRFLKQDYSGSNNVYWAPQENAFGIGSMMNEVTDMNGWSDFTEEVDYQWMAPQFVDPDNYDFRLKESSPLKDQESSLPTRSLDDSKIQELRDYLTWVNSLVDSSTSN
jgi:hypothetical protein